MSWSVFRRRFQHVMSACFSPSSPVIQEHCRLCWREGCARGSFPSRVLSPSPESFLSPSLRGTELSRFSSFLPASSRPLLCSHLFHRAKFFPPSAFVVYESYCSTSLPGAELFKGGRLMEKGVYARKPEDELPCDAVQAGSWVETWLREAAFFGDLLVDRSWPSQMPWSQAAPWRELLRSLVHPACARMGELWSLWFRGCACQWMLPGFLCSVGVRRCVWWTWWEVTVLAAKLLGRCCQFGVKSRHSALSEIPT